MNKKLVLIDGNAIMHRAFHALPPLTTRLGEPINAVYGLTSMLLRIITDLEPTHIAVCFDRKEPTFRKKGYKKYQAHRPKMDEELSSQFEKAKKVLSAMNIPVFEKAGFEADDVIGTISKKAGKKLDETVIITGDKDILQLVDNKTRVYMPIRGLSQGRLMKKKDVIEKLGIKPGQVIDYKALVGDPSDNYPGVYGIGPKTAEKLLLEYGTYKNIYKNIEKIPDSIKTKLEKGKEGGEISYKLAKIVKNVPLKKIDFNEMRKWKINNKRTLNLFKDFGFKTLTNRIKDLGEDIDKKNQMSLL